MKSLRRWLGVLMCAAALAAWGCSSKPATSADSPDKLWTLFDKAMKSGNFEKAAALVDYQAQAKSENSDVEEVSKSGQNLIGKKMKEDTEKGLKGLNYPSDGMKAEAPVVSGDKATVSATGGGQTITLTMAKEADGWRIVGGVPGMTAN